MHVGGSGFTFYLDAKCLGTQEMQCDFPNQNQEHIVYQWIFVTFLGKGRVRNNLVVKVLDFLQHLTGL